MNGYDPAAVTAPATQAAFGGGADPVSQLLAGMQYVLNQPPSRRALAGLQAQNPTTSSTHPTAANRAATSRLRRDRTQSCSDVIDACVRCRRHQVGEQRDLDERERHCIEGQQRNDLRVGLRAGGGDDRQHSKVVERWQRDAKAR